MTTYQKAAADSHYEPVIVLFTAVWCGPCKTVKPLMEKLSRERKFILRQLDADENKDLMMSLGIRGVPAIVALGDGNMTHRRIGGGSEQQLNDFLDKVFGVSV